MDDADFAAMTRLVDEAKAVPIEAVVQRMGIELGRGGRFWPCPACGSTRRTNAAGIVKDCRDRWSCFACGARGTTLQLWLHAQGKAGRLELAELAREAAALLGQAVVEVATREAIRAQPLYTRAEVVQAWRRWQGADREVARWLRDVRGVAVLPGRERIGVVRGWGLRGRADLRAAVEAGPCAVAPLRSTHPERTGEVWDVLIRPIHPSIVAVGDTSPWSARTLNKDAGMIDGGYPVVYGDPVGALKGRVLIVGEGWGDQVTGEGLLRGVPGVRMIAGRCTSDLAGLMALWLRRFEGEEIVLLPHLDGVQTRCFACRSTWAKVSKRALMDGRCAECGGAVERRRPGIQAMEELDRALRIARPDLRVRWFGWRTFLTDLGWTMARFLAAGFTDLNDCAQPGKVGARWMTLRSALLKQIVGGRVDG